ncbi:MULTISPECIES: hypothetical protein [unclassified Nostoc]|uniref:hypothetical protein n=1 Tax=unclassified Nostoc TaxID=2593658 RepID=UPI002AD54586|nr:hypothetical protein [Nostoc sp. DedQUE03]MDZ7977270.1 hypothetical protein [Nostoc sp. DedQUE03]MDZ8047609.1 hypothetical protein [Nostoc sp. DedQUE02]
MELLTTSTSDFAGIPMTMGIDSEGISYVKAVDIQTAVDKPDNSYRDFLEGKSLEALQAVALASGKKLFKVVGYNKPVAFIPTEATAHYWIYQAKKGNKKAQALVTADLAASLDRQAKKTNGIDVTDAQLEATRARIMDKLYLQWLNLPKSQWSSIWRDSDLIEDIKTQYLALTNEEQKEFLKKHSGLEFQKLHYSDGTTDVMVRDLTGI